MTKTSLKPTQQQEPKYRVKPVGDRVLVRILKDELLMTAGGLHIPEMAAEKPNHAIVEEIGEGQVLENGTVLPIPLKVGQRVMIGRYAGIPLEINGVNYQVVRADEILLRLEEV